MPATRQRPRPRPRPSRPTPQPSDPARVLQPAPQVVLAAEVAPAHEADSVNIAGLLGDADAATAQRQELIERLYRTREELTAAQQAIDSHLIELTAGYDPPRAASGGASQARLRG